MKRFCVAALCTVVFAVVLLCVKPHPAFAQQTSQIEWRYIRLHAARPDIMAYFIDPKHQKEPVEFKIPSLTDHEYSSQDFINVMKSGAPELAFDGVLAVADKQNSLWVLSNQNTFDQTKQFVDFMDRPFTQCELELQVVKVSEEDLKSLETQPIQPVLKNPSQQFPYKFSILTANSRGALQALLQKLVSQGKAKILNSPRLTTLNHLTRSLASATITPISVEVKNNFTGAKKDTPNTPLAFDATDGYQIGRITQFRTVFTPDINEAANTISLDLNISADEGISRYETTPKDIFSNHDQIIWFRNQVDPPLAARVNVADNQALVITSLDSTMLGFDKKHDNIAIFLTARIIHRAE